MSRLTPDLILASASPRRLKLLHQIGLNPTSLHPPLIDETPLKGERPSVYAKRMALEKGRKVYQEHPHAYIVAADTVVACGRRILGKPENCSEARSFLNLLSGRAHRVYTALCVHAPDGRVAERLVQTRLRFKRLENKEIEAYLETGEWADKAGGYALQGYAAAFILSVSGSSSSVVGLPLYETQAVLKGLGYPVLITWTEGKSAGADS